MGEESSLRHSEGQDGLWDGAGVMRAFVFDLVETEALKTLSLARAAEQRPFPYEGRWSRPKKRRS